MSTALASIATDRLAKLIRLVFSSDKDGEIVAAVAAAKRMLRSAGLDPHFVADAFLRGAQPDTPSISPDAQGDDRSTIWWCWHHRDRLVPRDREFIKAMTAWRGTLSTKQRKWLGDIVDKLAEGVSA